MSVAIRWSGAAEDDPEFISPLAADQTYLAPGEWADCEANAESAVNDLAEAWFESESEWIEYFGEEATIACVLIDVHAPAALAGHYIVDLQRVVKAQSKKVGEFPT